MENTVNNTKSNSDTVILLVLILIMGLLMIGGYLLFKKEIKVLNDEIVHMKEVLTEYGIYIDEQPHLVICFIHED